MTDDFSTQKAKASEWFRYLRDQICAAFEALEYTQTDGPAWLNVETNGVATGTPLLGDVGTNTFTVTVDDGVFPPVPVVLIRLVGKSRSIHWHADIPLAARVNVRQSRERGHEVTFSGQRTHRQNAVNLERPCLLLKFTGCQKLKVAYLDTVALFRR